MRGLRIRLDGASTVLVQSSITSRSDALIEFSNGSIAYTNSSPEQDSDAEHDFRGADTGYTFIDGVLEFTDEFRNATIYCRPAGKNCRWQAFNVRGAAPARNVSLNTSEVIGGKVTLLPLLNSVYNETLNVNIIPNTLTFTQPTRTFNINTPTDGKLDSKLIFTVKSGTAASFNYAKPPEWWSVKLPRTRGKTTITENRVTVAADATSADSINSQYLQVIVED